MIVGKLMNKHQCTEKQVKKELYCGSELLLQTTINYLMDHFTSHIAVVN